MSQSEDFGGMDSFSNKDRTMTLVEESPVPKSYVSFKDGNEELDNKIRSMMERINGAWTCNACGKVDKLNRSNIKKHIESMHIVGGSHPCSICGKECSSRNGLQSHVFRNHQQNFK